METEDELKSKEKTPVTERDWFARWRDVPLTTVIALIAFFGVRQLLLSSIETLWWRDMLSAVVGGIILVGYDYAIKSDNKPNSSAITSFIIALLIITLVYDYTGDRVEQDQDDSPVVNTTVDIESLKFGDNVYALDSAESTPWLKFPNGTISNYTITSPDYNYTLLFSDDSRYQGGANVRIPKKKNCYLKVIAKSKQVVTVKVSG